MKTAASTFALFAVAAVAFASELPAITPVKAEARLIPPPMAFTYAMMARMKTRCDRSCSAKEYCPLPVQQSASVEK